MYVMADTARQSNVVPSPSSGRANPSPGQRTQQNSRSSGEGGRGGRREADDKSAPRRNDVGTYGWGSEEVKRQGRNGRRGESRGQGRGGTGVPGAAQRRDNSGDRFIAGGGLPQWSDPFPRPERIGAQCKQVLEATGSQRTRAEPVMRESGSAGGLYHEGGAVSSDLAQNGLARGSGRSQLQGDGRNTVTRMRLGDSPSPLRGESTSQVGDSRSPSRGELRSSLTGSQWQGEVRSPVSDGRNSGSRYDEGGGHGRGGLKAPMIQTNAKFSGLDGKFPVQTIASSLTYKESGGPQRGVPAAQNAGRGSSRYTQENRQMLVGYGGVVSGHSGADFHAPRDGNSGHPDQRDRTGRGKVEETRGHQSGWVQVGSSRGSGAIGRSQTSGNRGDRQDDYREDENVERSRNFNRGHSSKTSWGTDSLSDYDIRSITSEESTSRKGSQPRIGRDGLRRVAVGTVLRTNHSEARSESSQEGEHRSRRERKQPRESFRKDNDSVGCEIATWQTSPAITYVRGTQSVTKQASPSFHDGLRRMNDPGGTGRLKKNTLITEAVETDRTHQSDTQTTDAMTQVHRAMYSESSSNRANWRLAREKGDNRLYETYNRQASQDVSLNRQPRLGVAASLGTDKNKRDESGLKQRIVGAREDRLLDLHAGEAVAVSQTSYGGNRGGPVNIQSEFPAKELGRRQGSAIYKSIAVDMVGGDGEILPSIVGTCPDMCPARERGRRERLRDLSVLERVNGQLGKTSRDLAVKKFCRTLSSLELKQSDVRPLPVLRMTLDYLWTFLDRKDISFKTVHDFLFDRTRAVRQDIGMQQLVSRQAIGICEEIVRFHIISERELHEQSLSDKYFNSDLNRQQLSKTLFTLLNMYAAYDFKDRDLQYEAEFHAYFVLLNLGVDQAEALSMWFSVVQQPLLDSTELRFARNVLRCFRMGNFQKYFQLVKQATYLQACLLELAFNQVRAHALAVLNQSSYKLHPYPIADLAELLLIEEEDVKSLCTFYGLPVGVQNSSQAECLLVKLAQFSVPENPSPWYHCRQVEAKRPSSHLVAVLGTA